MGALVCLVCSLGCAALFGCLLWIEMEHELTRSGRIHLAVSVLLTAAFAYGSWVLR